MYEKKCYNYNENSQRDVRAAVLAQYIESPAGNLRRILQEPKLQETLKKDEETSNLFPRHAYGVVACHYRRHKLSERRHLFGRIRYRSGPSREHIRRGRCVLREI